MGVTVSFNLTLGCSRRRRGDVSPGTPLDPDKDVREWLARVAHPMNPMVHPQTFVVSPVSTPPGLHRNRRRGPGALDTPDTPQGAVPQTPAGNPADTPPDLLAQHNGVPIRPDTPPEILAQLNGVPLGSRRGGVVEAWTVPVPN